MIVSGTQDVTTATVCYRGEAIWHTFSFRRASLTGLDTRVGGMTGVAPSAAMLGALGLET